MRLHLKYLVCTARYKQQIRLILSRTKEKNVETRVQLISWVTYFSQTLKICTPDICTWLAIREIDQCVLDTTISNYILNI